MVRRSLSTELDLWNKARVKVIKDDLKSVSSVITKLLRLFVKGDLDDYFKK